MASRSRRVDLQGVALPLSDQLIVIAPDDTVLALDAGGRRLWEALEAGCSLDDLAKAGVEHGGLSLELAQANVANTLESWRALGLVDAPGPPAPATLVMEPAPARQGGRAPALDAVYLVGDTPVRVRCENVALGKVLDAACGSHRIDANGSAVGCVAVIEQSDGLAVTAEGASLARTNQSTRNLALARHRCLTALLEAARPQRRWLGILHASAVAAGGSCVVFAGARGSGKSTLAAALVAAGAQFVTDDYAPLERASWCIWPVPYAPGIKRGSWRPLRRYYPDLLQQPVHRLADHQIRYLELDAGRIAPLGRGLPVAALVFPRYRAGSALTHEPITVPAAFADLCHARSLLDRQPEVLAETLRWIGSIPAYSLTYGDVDRAIEWVLTLWGSERPDVAATRSI